MEIEKRELVIRKRSREGNLVVNVVKRKRKREREREVHS
jgi:hypothetical protein